MEKLGALIANEPIALLGILGITIAWLVKVYSEKVSRQTESRRQDEERKSEALNTISRSGYLVDRVRHKQQIIFRFENEAIKSKELPKNEVEEALKYRKKAIQLTDDLTKEVAKFSYDGDAFDCLMRAKKLHGKLERGEAMADDSLRAILGKPPI